MSNSRNRELERHGQRKGKSRESEYRPSPMFFSSVEGKSRMENGPSFDSRGRSGDGWGEEMEMEKESDDRLQDPLMVFGSGIMTMILNKVDARSVALSRLVSHGWLVVASSDEIWGPKTAELWLGKAHIPRMAKVPGLSKMMSYSRSVMDGKRTRITRDDLCDRVWEFHFTEGAPEYWRNLDPYWGGDGPPMRRYFHQDGTITADPEDRVWGGHESCYTIVTGLLADGSIRRHYVRINRWPEMTVQRKPDWGWELSNHLYCYISIPDADNPEGTGPPFPQS